MSPVPYTWGPFSAKIFLKIWFCKIDPLLPPHIDFNTIPYFTYGCPYRGVKEGKLKSASGTHAFRVSAKGDRGGPWTPPIFFPEKSGFLQEFGGDHGPPQEKWGFGGCR